MYIKRRYRIKLWHAGNAAGDEWNRFYMTAINIVSGFYVLLLIHVFTGFDLWGLVSTVTFLDFQLFRYAGLIASIVSLAAIATSRLTLGVSWRVGIEPSACPPLVTHGIYKRIRHPYFTALLGFQLSLILMLPNTITCFAFLQSMVILNFQARHEETYLKSTHGDTYEKYLQSSGRFLPWSGRRRKNDNL